MIKDVEPLLKECEETLAELKRIGNMEAACYVQGFINSIKNCPMRSNDRTESGSMNHTGNIFLLISAQIVGFMVTNNGYLALTATQT